MVALKGLRKMIKFKKNTFSIHDLQVYRDSSGFVLELFFVGDKMLGGSSIKVLSNQKTYLFSSSQKENKLSGYINSLYCIRWPKSAFL